MVCKTIKVGLTPTESSTARVVQWIRISDYGSEDWSSSLCMSTYYYGDLTLMVREQFAKLSVVVRRVGSSPTISAKKIKKSCCFVWMIQNIVVYLHR